MEQKMAPLTQGSFGYTQAASSHKPVGNAALSVPKGKSNPLSAEQTKGCPHGKIHTGTFFDHYFSVQFWLCVWSWTIWL